MEIIPLQQEFRPAFPNVYGAADYREFRATLIKMDELLVKSHLEHDLVMQALTRLADSHDESDKASLSQAQANYHYQQLRHALRCNIARHLTGESYRAFSIRLMDSSLFQWFTLIHAFGSRCATSKSSLERYEKCFDANEVKDKITKGLNYFSSQEAAHAVGLAEAIDFKETFMDSTCVKANIHFPVDWVLLRDAARSLLSAIKTIREQGLNHRMIAPSQLLKSMNQLCIKMTHTRRKKDSKKQRKAILREMKKLSQCIKKHAKRYRQLLLDSWTKTTWSEAQMQCVIKRMDTILEQLPAAIKQAHERIIGERQVKSSDKILSLYDKEVAIMVRGKAGNEVEFGQKLLLTEQRDGLIIDWELFSKAAPSDNQLLQPSIKRMETSFGAIASVSTDRAFASAKNDEYLADKNIFNATCPRSPAQLKEKLNDPLFSLYQTRRSQTESRIGIFKNVFLGRPLRSRMMSNKAHAVNWCVLTHNLWVLSRKAIADELSALEKAA